MLLPGRGRQVDEPCPWRDLGAGFQWAGEIGIVFIRQNAGEDVAEKLLKGDKSARMHNDFQQHRNPLMQQSPHMAGFVSVSMMESGGFDPRLTR